MDRELQRLQDLQGLDTRIAGLERKLEGIPIRIQAIRDGVQQATAAADTLRTRLDGVKKELRAKEKDLDYQAAQRAKCEAKLYEVKTNKEYSAVLAEIETLKVEKGRIEEEILALMEAQERMTREVAEADARRERQTQDGRTQEAAAEEELRALEADVAAVRGERESLAREIPRELLTQYARVLKGRAGLAVAVVGASGICAGCRVSLTPQRFQEVRQSTQIFTCESCGRFLYYQP